MSKVRWSWVSALIISVIAIVSYAQTAESYWTNDSMRYAYVFPAGDFHDSFRTREINSFGDIVESQINHYQGINGRTPVHIVVQIFCGLIKSRIPFYCANALIWSLLTWLFVRSCRIDWRERWSLPLAFLLLQLAIPVEHDPSNQINYVWVAAFLLLWWRKSSDIQLVPLALLSFLAGWTNEAFGFSIAGAFVIFACQHRFRLTRRQWVMAVCFTLGLLPILLSPAGYGRLQGIQPTLGYRLMGSLLQLWMLLIWLPTFIRLKRKEGISVKEYYTRNAFVINLIGIDFLLMLGVGHSFSHVAVPLKIAMAYLTLRCMATVDFRGPLKWAIAGLSLLLMSIDFVYASEEKEHKALAEAKVDAIPLQDSLVWYSDEELSSWQREHYEVYKWRRLSKSADAPMIRFVPERLRGIPSDADTNLCVEAAPDHWLIVQSKTRPARFFVDRTVGFGPLRVDIGSRELTYNVDHLDNYLIETDAWWAGLYFPKSPLMRARVSMLPPEQLPPAPR